MRVPANGSADTVPREIQQLPFSNNQSLERPKRARLRRPGERPYTVKEFVKRHCTTGSLLRRIRAAVDTYFIYRRTLRASRSTSVRFALKRLALSAPKVHRDDRTELTLLGRTTEALTMTTAAGHENVPAEQAGPRFPPRPPLGLKGTRPRSSNERNATKQVMSHEQATTTALRLGDAGEQLP